MLIALFGPDGSGKTTLARALTAELRRRSLKPLIMWMRGTHTLASLIARLLSKFATFRGPDNPYYGISVPNSMRRLWQLMEFASALPVLLAKFILLDLLGYVVIAERFVPDFLVWVSLTTRDESYFKRLEAKFMLALSMKADVKVYVTASEAELIKRRRGEVGRDFLRRQLRLYDRIAKLVRAHKIDTTKSHVEEALDELLGLIQQLLTER